MWQALQRWSHIVLRNRPRDPYLPGSESDMSYDAYRDPSDTPGQAALAVVNPDGTRLTYYVEKQLGEVILELRRLRIWAENDSGLDLEKEA